MAFAKLKLQIVVTLAGQSSRFRKLGVMTPKPMLPILGRPMVSYALESVEPILNASRLIGVVCKEDHIACEVKEIFQGFSKSAEIFETQSRTAGPVQTVLSIKSHLDMEAPLLILDGDIYFKSPRFLNQLVTEPAFTAIPGGLLLSFESTNPAFSYSREGSDGKIVEIAEKRVISRSALIGAYHFRTAGEFINCADSLVNIEPLREHYISHVIQILIDDGAEFRKTIADFHLSFGTPEELTQSERRLIEINPSPMGSN